MTFAQLAGWLLTHATYMTQCAINECIEHKCEGEPEWLDAMRTATREGRGIMGCIEVHEVPGESTRFIPSLI